jgi:PIN domain nuclease of toxin-antitoxin system
VRLLIDTHVLIWALEGGSKLSASAKERLLDTDDEHWVSAASVWEIAIKASVRKLTLSRALRDSEKGILAAGFRVLDKPIRHAVALPGVIAV